MRHRLILLLAAVAAVPLFGQYQVQVDPPVPVEGEPFTVTVSGTWRDSCVPQEATVFFTGNWIIPTFTLSGNACLPAVVPFEADVTIPGRWRGNHRILLRVIDFDGTVRPLAETTVTVTPSAVEPLHSVYPSFGPSDRRTQMRIAGPFHCAGAECSTLRVWFGDMEAEDVRIEGDTLIYAYTPLTTTQDEVVDVVVQRGSQEWRLPGGFRYLARDEFERILVPIWFRGNVPGANGSVWSSQFRLYNGHDVELVSGIDLLSVDDSCPFLCTGVFVGPGEETSLPLNPPHDSSIPSAMLYVHRTLVKQISLQARTRDLSRQSSTWGTEVPVVRGSTVSPSVIRLLDVPLDNDFRVMLRMYGLADGGLVVLRVFDAGRGTKLLEESIPLQISAESLDPWSSYPREPAYAQVANLQERQELQDVQRVRIEMYGTAGPIWGMASVTHVESQHVTLVTPQ